MAFTYFFRDMHALGLIEQYVIPRLRTRRYIDIWDAGCATGAEPYTLAMILRENMGEFLFRNVRIYATDLNAQFEKDISEAIYPEDQIKRITPSISSRYFAPADRPGYVQVISSIRDAVTFQQHDLRSLTPVKGGFSLIVCKNVLLHLNPDQRTNVLRMFHSALADDGFLATEQTQKMPCEALDWFEPVHQSGSVFRRIGSPQSAPDESGRGDVVCVSAQPG